MAKYLPKPLHALLRRRGSRIHGFTSDNAAINEIERRCHEKNSARSNPANRGGQKKSRPKDVRLGTLNYSGRWSGMESVEHKKSRLSGSFSVLYARTPLPIVAHILPGRPVVVRPTLGAMGSSRLARYEGADACLSSAEPADVHHLTTPGAVKFHGEGRGGNC
jgi:hypothetical protein